MRQGAVRICHDVNDRARNQLEALRNQPWAQRVKRVAEPAYLRLDGAVEDLMARL